MTFSKLVFGFIFLTALVSKTAYCADVVEITVEETSAASTPAAARQAIFETVIQKTTLAHIQDIIGQQKLESNKALIRNKILKNSGKYIISMKSTPPVKSADGYTMNVTLKTSLSNLEALLLEEGLLYRLEGSPQVLPMISFQDRVNAHSFSWWIPDSALRSTLMLSQHNSLLAKLRREMGERGFYCMAPEGRNYRLMIPSTFMTESPRIEDYSFLGDYFGAQIVVKGFFRFSKSRSRSDAYEINTKLLAIHAGNGRVVGEVIRSYETEVGQFQAAVQRKMQEVLDSVAKDLSLQIYDAWKRGSFGSNILRLSINGQLNYIELNSIKKQILEQVRDIRTLKERFFEDNRVVYEMDSSSATRQIAQIVSRIDFEPYKAVVSKITSDSLKLDV
ncbi:MAG: hypothetical protein KDD35_09435, partial [Bdellovibrionales bacterium]|nr:hypothetical protein [Bdellovibrionales bacterium]